MKTSIIITAAILLISATLASASSTIATLTFYGPDGHEMTMPAMEETAEEPVPLNIRSAFQKNSSSESTLLIDISELTKPEKEEALPFDPKKVLESLK